MRELKLRIETLTSGLRAATRLVEVACPKRIARAGDVKVAALIVSPLTVHATVEGGSGTYKVSINHHPNRAWNCTCPDAGIRGRAEGPCKHAVAVARAVGCRINDEMAAIVVISTTV
jgi:uncharacterized Zn finger protein